VKADAGSNGIAGMDESTGMAASGDEAREIKRGDICWAHLPGAGAGTEQRPVLVIQNDLGNHYAASIIVAAITRRVSQRPFPINVIPPDGLLPGPSEIRTGQIHTIGRSCIGALISRMPAGAMAQVDRALRLSLGLPVLE